MVELRADARRNLERFPRVAVVVSPFEEWPLPAKPFDLVVSATAFHWVDPEIRVVKAADALRPGGVLATFGSQHVAGGAVFGGVGGLLLGLAGLAIPGIGPVVAAGPIAAALTTAGIGAGIGAAGATPER